MKGGVKVTMSRNQPCAHSSEAVVKLVAPPEWALDFSSCKDGAELGVCFSHYAKLPCANVTKRMI